MTQPNGGPGRLVIVGAGGFGREVRDLVRQCGGEVVGFLADTAGVGELDAPLLGDVAADIEADLPYLCAIGVPRARRPVLERLTAAGRPAASPILHPSVIVGHDVRFEHGTIVCAGAILTTNVRIGAHVILNLACTVGHDATIGDGSALMPGVHVSGAARLGRDVFVGTGAVILEGVVIGEGATIGAGAVVTHDVDDGATVVGVPARPVRPS